MQQEPRWKSKQRVVSLLEKALSPQSRVEHDVWLKELVTKTPRQCDTVIYTEIGEGRTTVSIVEVQDRNKAVELPIFDGWLEKGSAVGAQHLVCVSSIGFPESVVKKAATRGPMVVLLTLRDLEQGQFPLYFDQSVFPFFDEKLDKARVNIYGFGDSTQKMDIPSDEEFHFQYAEGNGKISLKQIVDEAFQKATHARNLAIGTHKIVEIFQRGEGEQELYLVLRAEKKPIRQISVEMRIVVEVTELPLAFSKYQRFGQEDPLAWLAIAAGTVYGQMVQIRAVLRPNTDGLLRLAAIEIDGLPPDKRLRFILESPLET